MAITNRSKAGRFAWEMYRRRVSRWLYLVLFLCFLWPVLAFGVLLSQNTSLSTTLLVLVLFAESLYLLYRKADEASLRWEDGARGEILVGKELEKLHKEGFHIFHDYHPEGRGNVDHFVVGPSGIFVVETKAWKGEISVRNDRFLVDGKPSSLRDPVKQVKGEAKDVHDLVEKHTGINIFVRPVLCFSKGELRHHEAVQGVEITTTGSLNRTIMQISHRTPDYQELSASQVRVISLRLQRQLEELPAPAPGSPPEEPGRLRQVLTSGGFFVAFFLFYAFVVSVIFADSTSQTLEALAGLYDLAGLAREHYF